MVDIFVREQNAGDGAVARGFRVRLQVGRMIDLPRKIGRSVNQEPVFVVAGNGDTRLSLRCYPAFSRGDTIRAGTIPLRQAAPRRTTKNPNTNRVTPGGSDRPGVTRALEENRDVFERRFEPTPFGSFH